ncbi:MAG: F0F1 ATP synthase subunit epsilon, F-type H+-transporting ATPase subunit epsilon [Microgenomates group bacterium GW2011_GWC1_49_7]|nr:MAG: F0F1 ATP synthase subunit epsilon, F-type H+-transporting ATPase subunit epsilon [Microgenomates group bacterium GW2011_GWC1_49_7]KKW45122.1 MAG: ATP synthase epsilon chain [Parcubacteria group bacterium GW2011_GWB1_56_8]
MKLFHLDVITPQRNVFSEEISSVVVPTVNGSIGVLALHEPLFSALTEGEIKIASGGKEYFLAIGGGFMEVTKTGVLILVSRAFHAHELNEAEIKKAQAAAKEAIAKRATGEELAAAQAIFRRSVLELKVLHRRRPHTPLYPSH